MKKKNKGERNFPFEEYKKTKVNEENIGEFNKEKMKKFAANVQLARAIPDIYDGFKPVGRRTLYAIAIIAKAYKKNKYYTHNNFKFLTQYFIILTNKQNIC